MNKKFVEKLQNYYDNSDEFKKRTILWASKSEIMLSDETMRNSIHITDKALEQLDELFNDLDGTLLCDLVMKFMNTHKIYK